jgi:glycosyltransferase involved in cell wall biosynthesis
MTGPEPAGRILLITVYYLPSTQAVVQMARDLAYEFLGRGYEVSVLAPDSTLQEKMSVTDEDGVQVIRVRSGKLKHASRIQRTVNEARLSGVLWRGARDVLESQAIEVVVYFSPTIFFGRLVKRLKALWNCQSYLVLRDIFPQWAVDAGILRKGLVFRYFHREEMRQYDAADVIGVQSPANLDYFASNPELGKYSLEVLYNWIREPAEQFFDHGYRQQWGLEGKVVFVFGGNIGIAQGVENLVTLAEGLRQIPEAHVLIVGSGSKKKWLEERFAKLGLSNASVHGPLDQDRYLAMLFEFDVGLVLLDPSLRTQNFPGKMLGYLAAGMPILAALNQGNDLQRIIDDADAGFVCSSSDQDSLIELARKLARSEDLRRRQGQNARKLLRSRFSVAAAADQISGAVLPHAPTT